MTESMITGSKNLGLNLCNWHGGMWSSTYAVGSSFIASFTVPEESIKACICELQDSKRSLAENPETRLSTEYQRNVNELDTLIGTLQALIDPSSQLQWEDTHTLDQLVQYMGECMEKENWESCYATADVIKCYILWEKALHSALLEVVTTQPELLTEGTTLQDIIECDAPYNVLMTLRGEGVGIWDGRWDHLFMDGMIPELERYLEDHKELQKYCCSGGLLDDAFMIAVDDTHQE